MKMCNQERKKSAEPGQNKVIWPLRMRGTLSSVESDEVHHDKGQKEK